MGPTSFPAPARPKLFVRCTNARGNNASKHLRGGNRYEVLNIVPAGSETAKGKSAKTSYQLRGVEYLWDADRFDATT